MSDPIYLGEEPTAFEPCDVATANRRLGALLHARGWAVASSNERVEFWARDAAEVPLYRVPLGAPLALVWSSVNEVAGALAMSPAEVARRCGFREVAPSLSSLVAAIRRARKAMKQAAIEEDAPAFDDARQQLERAVDDLLARKPHA